MADVFSKSKRSEVMSKIRSRGNRDTELRLVTLLKEAKIAGWRRHQELAGKPDFVFPKERVVVFVDGCFWHGCSRCYKRPHSNQSYWDKKLARNRARDRHVNLSLRRSGWKVIRLWEHSLLKPVITLLRIKRALEAGREARISKEQRREPIPPAY